jgi:hypothetical protein
MNDPKKALASPRLANSIRLRWALRDIKANRLKLSPVDPNDLRTLIDMGAVSCGHSQMRNRPLASAAADHLAFKRTPG